MRLFRWILGLLPLLVAIAVGLFTNADEDAIAAIGGGAQVAGLALVLYTLNETLRRHGKPDLLQQFLDGNEKWLRRLMGKPGNVVVIVPTGSAIALGTVADAVIKVELDDSQPLPERVRRLEKAHDALFDRVNTVTTEARKEIRALKKLSKAETTDRVEEFRGIRQELADSELQRVPIDVTGAFLFLQGIVLSAWPGLIA